ncbi:MAG: hypothetical protein V3S64_08765, partial [bacterium]
MVRSKYSDGIAGAGDGGTGCGPGFSVRDGSMGFHSPVVNGDGVGYALHILSRFNTILSHSVPGEGT